MNRVLATVSYLVRDYEEAITFFTEVLDFELVEDLPLPEQNKRWVIVQPRGEAGARLLLAKPDRPSDLERVGSQAGERVFLFLQTDDFWRDYEAFRAKGLRFMEKPREEAYGTVAVFADLYGNLWDLIEPKN